MWLHAMAHHRPTAFGSRTGLDLLVRTPDRGVAVMVAVDRNLTGTPFATLDVTAHGLPLGPATLTPRAAVWWQPEGLRPYAARGRPGGLLSTRAEVGLDGPLSLWLEAEAKSRGEVSGNPWLDPMGAVRAGLTLDTL